MSYIFTLRKPRLYKMATIAFFELFLFRQIQITSKLEDFVFEKFPTLHLVMVRTERSSLHDANNAKSMNCINALHTS